MNESAPAPTRPPVPWWERLAAGLLAAAWVVYVERTYGSPRHFVADARELFGMMQFNLSWLFPMTGLGVQTLLESSVVIGVVQDTLKFALLITLPVLIVWMLAIACGWHRRRWRAGLWWLVLGYSAAGIFLLLAEVRQARMTPSIPGLEPIPTEFPNQSIWTASEWVWFWMSSRNFPLLLAQILLAAFVLGFGWWQRRRAKAAAAG